MPAAPELAIDLILDLGVTRAIRAFRSGKGYRAAELCLEVALWRAIVVERAAEKGVWSP